MIGSMLAAASDACADMSVPQMSVLCPIHCCMNLDSP